MDGWQWLGFGCGTFFVVLVVIAVKEQRAQHHVKRSLQAFLGVGSIEDCHFVSGTRENKVFVMDFERSLAAFLQREGLPYETRGTCGLMCPPGAENNAIELRNMLAGGFIGPFGSPNERHVAIGPDEKEFISSHLMYLVRGPAGPFIVRTWLPGPASDQTHFEAASAKDEELQNWLKGLMGRLDEYVSHHSIFKKQAITPQYSRYGSLDDLCFLSLTEMDEVVLCPALVATIDDGFLYFLDHADELAARGVSPQRGLFLCGEPGTGKTTTCRYIRSRLPEQTFIIGTAHDVENCRLIFSIARRLAPATIVLEDIDLAVSNRSDTVCNGPLQGLLNELDGLQARERISIILTSNSWQFIDRALADRPGRIDQVIHLEKPNGEHRMALLSRYTEKVTVETSLDEISELGKGLTPAQLREWVNRAIVQAMKRGPNEPLEHEDFLVALRAVKKQYTHLVDKPTIGLGRTT